ncbi:MAG: TonB-dependent receptor plug domain-containing protein [Gammaproteobacteria bacterium]
MEELITIGTRSQEARSISDSPVPIDIIGGEEFNSLGSTADITDNMRATVPSFTATPATGDGSAFIRTTSLRGTAADQTLVLVDGKRRHRSALVQFLAPAAGNGSHAPDIGMIPAIAIKRVEVLRDGAASQYGSDAIAGVINFVTKDAAEGGDVQVQYGQFYEDEENIKVAANGGFPLGDIGFVNVSGEWVDNEGLSRGIQRPDAQALIDSGVTEVGQDAVFGDAPLAQSWGRPETSGFRLFVNSGFEVSDSAEVYARFGYGDTEGRYRFFFRNPNTHSVFTGQLPFGAGCPVCDPDPASDPLDLIPDTQSLREQGFTGLPGGFTPFLDGDQKDASIVVGLEGDFDSGMHYDVSFGYGKNELTYFLNNTANSSLGPGDFTTLPKMDFDVGGYEQQEYNVNADFSLPLSDSLNLGFGAEWREETYTAIEGEPDSFFGNGASGLKGVTPEDSGENSRQNVALYADLEQDLTEAWLLQYAVRFEDFSDFGDTINGKLASRFRISDSFAIRGAVSTGFHAPTPGQASVRTTITTADSSSTTGLVEEGLIPATDPLAAAVGGKPLKEETTVNYSVGFTADFFENTTLTVDAYLIEVDDRIYKTGDIPNASGVGTIAFYTNALDVEHTGVDVVLTSNTEWFSSNVSTDWSFAFSYNEVDVTGQTAVETPTGPVLPVSQGNIDNIENNFPNERFVLSANTLFGESWSFLIRANYYGDHLDERGTLGVDKAEIDPVIFVDVDLGFAFNDNWRFNLGAVNVFDEFPDKVLPPFSNRLSNGLEYPRRTAANYEGGSWYLRGTYSF